MPSPLSWLDDRTGYKSFLHDALYEHIPGGARWRYVWGSTLVFAFSVQMVTGLVLWMHYSPSTQTAWESVYFVQHQMAGGWLLRGIHHFTAQVMIVLLALHMLQVIIDGAYRAPREINFWIGLVLLNLVLGLSLTGYLLPWDQKGYAATKVATSILHVVPGGVGPALQQLALGGAEYGHHTLTRFFAMHAGLLPFLMIAFIGIHVYLFRRHGLRYKEPRRASDSYFWPDQVLRDAVACLGVLAVVLMLCVRHGLTHGGFDDPGRLGAELSAPADPAEAYGAARPEWYFLFLFQFLKLPAFAGHGELYGAVVVPGVIMLLLFLMPLTGRWKVGHWFNVGLTVFLATGIVLLTAMALVEDAGPPRLRLPGLGSLGIRFAAAWGALLALGAIVLIPLVGRERSFRFNAAALGALILGLAVILAVHAAGGGSLLDDPGSSTAAAGGVPFFLVYRWTLAALLAALALLVTVLLLKSPVRVSGRLAADEPVTAAADAEVAGAADAHTGAGPGTPPEPGEVEDGSWVRRWEWHHRARLAMLFVATGGAVLLTAVSLVGGHETAEKRLTYQASVRSARTDAERVIALAGGPAGIPPQGAVWLLRNDPLTQGPRLFARNCASCHRYDGHNGLGAPVTDPQSAPDLKGFASREWVRGLLDPARVDSVHYFGPNMKSHAGKMVNFVKTTVADAMKDEHDRAELESIVAALSAEARLPSQSIDDVRDAGPIAEGQKAIVGEAFECADCHSFREKKVTRSGSGRGPDLTGYGSHPWLAAFLHNPAHPRFYGPRNDRMPAFGDQKLLTDHQIVLIVNWLRGEDARSSDDTPPPTELIGTGTAPPDTVVPPGTTKPATAPDASPATVPASSAPAPPATAPVTTAPAAPAPATATPDAPKPQPSKRPDAKTLESEFAEPDMP